MSLVRGLIKKARLTIAEIANAMANPNVNSSPLPKLPISSTHCIKIIFNNSEVFFKVNVRLTFKGFALNPVKVNVRYLNVTDNINSEIF